MLPAVESVSPLGAHQIPIFAPAFAAAHVCIAAGDEACVPPPSGRPGDGFVRASGRTSPPSPRLRRGKRHAVRSRSRAAGTETCRARHWRASRQRHPANRGGLGRPPPGDNTRRTARGPRAGRRTWAPTRGENGADVRTRLRPSGYGVASVRVGAEHPPYGCARDDNASLARSRPRQGTCPSPSIGYLRLSGSVLAGGVCVP